MNCETAQKLIDALPAAGSAEATSFEAHLADCPACARAFADRRAARALLAPLHEEKPSREEIDTMWQVVAAALPAPLNLPKIRSWSAIRRVGGIAAAVAICLTTAFLIGQERYASRSPRRAGFSSASADVRPDRADLSSGALRTEDFSGQDVMLGIPLQTETTPATVAETRGRAGAPAEARPRGASVIADNQAGDLVQEGSYGRYHLYSTEGVRKFVSPAGGRTNRFAADWHFYFDQSATAPAPADEVQLHPEQQAEAIAGQSASEEEVKAWHKILLMPDNWPEVVRAEVQAGRQPAGEPVPPPPAQDGAPPAASDRAAPSAPPAAKLIKTGELRAEVDDYAAAAERIETLVAEHGAFIADGGTQETTGGALSGNFVIRVAPARFDALFAALRQVGRIEAENVKVADVTAQYVDLEARIKSLQIAETRLQELAQKELKAEKAGEQMKALLEIERELNRVRTEIEQHEGQLRVLANRVAFSTINIAIHEPPRIVPSAQLGVEVPTLEGAALGLQEIVASLNARLATGQIEKRDNGALAGRYTLTVKLSHFGEALERLAALGRIDQRNVRDWHAPDAAAPWADRVDCTIELVLFERTTTLPAGEVELEVADVSAALVSLRELLPAHQAGVASSQTQQQSDGSSAATVQVRVPAGAFAEVADAIAALGRVLQRNLTGSTQQLAGGAAATPVTLTVRLSEPARQIPSGRFELTVAKFEPARQALVALVQQENVQVLAATSTQRQDGTWAGAFRLGIPAARMEAVIAALEALGDVTTRELTGLGLGELSRVHPQALGVLELSLGEKAAYSPGGLKAGNTLRKYLRDGLSGLYESLGLIVYGLVVMLPWLILVALATFLIVRLWRKPAARRQTPVT